MRLGSDLHSGPIWRSSFSLPSLSLVFVLVLVLVLVLILFFSSMRVLAVLPMILSLWMILNTTLSFALSNTPKGSHTLGNYNLPLLTSIPHWDGRSKTSRSTPMLIFNNATHLKSK